MLPWDREILALAATGLTNAEIGARMHIAAGTVQRRMCDLYPTLGVRNRAAAVHAAGRLGLLPDNGPEATAVEPDTPRPNRRASVLVIEHGDATRAGLMLALRDRHWVAVLGGCGRSGDIALLVRRLRPDIALVGGDTTQQSIVLCRALADDSPATSILMVEDLAPPGEAVLRASGASGTVLRGWPHERCAAAAHALWAAVPPATEESAQTDVSAREREVLEMLITGATNREIATRLGLSPHTVKQHTSSIYRKLGVRNRAEASGTVHADRLAG